MLGLCLRWKCPYPTNAYALTEDMDTKLAVEMRCKIPKLNVNQSKFYLENENK